MPLRLPSNLPAIELLKAENVHVPLIPLGEGDRDAHVRILILNLMPLKIDTETDFVRLFSNFPSDIELVFMRLDTHVSQHVPASHMEQFYSSFSEVKNHCWDGLIVTGAPVEHLDYEQVTYWPELSEIFEWARTHVRSTLYICWAAMAALYHFYNVPKYALPHKLFGVFRQYPSADGIPLFIDCDDDFMMPHSRHTTIGREDIVKHPDIQILAESVESGVGILMSESGRQFYFLGHFEYAPMTLDREYRRDMDKRSDVYIPKNYYPNDDMAQPPVVSWRAHAHLIFGNWLYHYVFPRHAAI